jgi:signal transduction histidine kinase/ActR/RegA family two-component response regulator
MTRFRGPSVATKLVLLIGLVVGALAITVFAVVPPRFDRQLRDALRDNSMGLCQMIASNVGPSLVFEDARSAQELLNGAGRNPDVLYAAVLRSDGRPLATFSRIGIGQPPAGPITAEWAFSADGSRLDVASPVLSDERTLGIVRIGVSLAKVHAEVSRARKGLAALSLLLFLAGTIAAYWISAFVVGPLRTLDAAVKRVAGGDHSERVQVWSGDEVGRLAAAFNRMVDSVESAQQALEDVNSDLEARVEERTRELKAEIDQRRTAEVALAGSAAEQKSLEEQLRQAQKMEGIGRLAGGIAHDFNNLLTAILGYAELMEEQLPDDEDLRSSLHEIHVAGERAAALTRQLLAFSRRQVLQPRILDLNVVVAEMEKLLRRLIGEDVVLTTRLDPRLASVKADPGQLEQVLMNLAVNARDAMPCGGRLTIETGNAALDAGFAAAHPGARVGAYAVITVADTGTGMSADVLSHVFEPFFTTKEQGKGTGLGLATAYGIVTQSDGFITVESELGRGTTFRIHFPRVTGKASLSSSGARRTVSPRGAETILLVEDEPGVRRLSRTILESLGYHVLEAASGEKALEVARAHVGEIHLVATDVIMPGMSGRVLWDRLRPLRPHTRVLFVSGYTDDAIAPHGVLEAATAFLQKPFTPHGLAEKVRQVLDAVPETRA